MLQLAALQLAAGSRVMQKEVNKSMCLYWAVPVPAALASAVAMSVAANSHHRLRRRRRE
jgi:hypothetical protein